MFNIRHQLYSQVFLDLGVIKATADEPLGCVQCVLRVGDSLAFGRHAHQTLPVGGESDDGRSRPGSLCVLQHLAEMDKSFRCAINISRKTAIPHLGSFELDERISEQN